MEEIKIKEIKFEDGEYKLEDGLYLNKKGKKYNLVYPPKKDKSKPFAKGNIAWKNLLIGKSWFDIIIILLLLFSAWAYQRDTSECRAILSNPSKICGGYDFNTTVDLTNFTFTENDWGDENNTFKVRSG